LDPVPAILPPVTSVADGDAHWKRMERTRMGWYVLQTRRIAQHFAREGAVIEEAVRRGGEGGTAIVMAEMAVNYRSRAWESVLTSLYNEVAVDFARKVNAGFKKAFGPESTKADDQGLLDLWRQVVLDWLTGGEAGKKISGITDTTRQTVARALQE